MFYDAVANQHGLALDPFKALVAPRPIGWISTLGKNGVVNLAPYSFFNAVSEDPHFVMFASGGRKDSQRNAEETGEFVCSLATYDLREAMSRTSAAVGPEIDEMRLAGLTPAPSRLVAPPRVDGVAGRVRMPLLAHHRAAGPERGAERACHRARPSRRRAYRRRGDCRRQGRRDAGSSRSPGSATAIMR